MKKFLIFALLASCLCLSSCVFSFRGDGRIMVSNMSKYSGDLIVEVFTRDPGTTSWTMRWNDSNGKALYHDAVLYVSPGKYDVKITVRRPGFYSYSTETFETGYMHPVRVEEDGLSTVIFDGNGIYW